MAEKGRFIVVGLGGFGSTIARKMYEDGHDVIAVDIDEKLVQDISDGVTRAVTGDGTRTDTLQAIGAEGATGAIISTGDDISASVLAALAFSDLGVTRIYVKVVSRSHKRIVSHFPHVEPIFPEEETAKNLAMRIEKSDSLLNYVSLGSGVSLQEMAVPSQWEGKTLAELSLRTRFRVSVVAVHDVISDVMHVVPDPHQTLLDSHTLILSGTKENLQRVAELP